MAKPRSRASAGAKRRTRATGAAASPPNPPPPPPPSVPRGITARTAALYRRLSGRRGLVSYLTRKQRPAKTWARALAIHAREQTAAQWPATSVVRRALQPAIAEYWFSQRVRRLSIEAFILSAGHLLAPSALQEAAEAIAIRLGKPWVQIIPPGLRAFFAIDLLESSIVETGSLRQSRVVQFAMESQCTPRREWTTFASDGLAGEVDEWMRNVQERHPKAVVLSFRTHLWYSQILAARVHKP